MQLSEQLKALVIPAPKPYYRRVLLQLIFCPSPACMRSGLYELLPGQRDEHRAGTARDCARTGRG